MLRKWVQESEPRAGAGIKPEPSIAISEIPYRLVGEIVSFGGYISISLGKIP